MTTSSHRTLLLFLITQLLALPPAQASRELLLNAPSPGDSLLLMQPSREWGPRGDLSRAERQKHNTRARHLRASHNSGQTVPYANGGSGPAGTLTYEEQQERLQWHIGAGLRLHLEEPTTQHEGQGDGSDARRADFKKGSSENRIVTKGQRKQILESLGLNSSSIHKPSDPLHASIASSDLTAAATKYPLAQDEHDLPSEQQQPEQPGQGESAAPPGNAAVRAPNPLAGGGRPNGRSAQRYSNKGSPLAQKKLSSAAQAVAMANAAEAAAEAEAAEALGSEGPGAQAQPDKEDTSPARVAIVPESPEKAAKHSALAQAAAAAEAAEGDHAHFLSEAARVHAEGGLQDGAERARDVSHPGVHMS